MKKFIRTANILIIAALFATSIGFTAVTFAVEPDTFITTQPSNTTTSNTATFEFSGDPEPVTFQCSIDAGPYASCTSPYVTPNLDIGAHSFSVRATNAGSETDSTPATSTWEIISPDITTCEQLVTIDDNGMLNDDFELMNDLDCTANGNDAKIGDNQNPYTGTFDGNDHTVTVNIDIDETSVGLFSQVTDGGQVNNLTVAGHISGGSNTGGIAGDSANASFSNVHNTATVLGTNYTGGLIGDANSGTSITGSSSSGDVSGDNSVGGLLGNLDSSSISSTQSTGNVTAIDAVGGAIGIATYAEITNTSSSGTVTSTGNYVGGFIGGSYCETSHLNSHASGDVTAAGSNVGGYAGDDGCEGPGSTYTQTYATGNVQADSVVGGFLGRANITVLNKTYALGNVTATGDYVGGLIGASTGYSDNPTEINESLALGDVTSTGIFVGGLVGRADNDGNFYTDVFARGAVTGSNYVGGILGYSSTGTTVNNGYATGHLSSDGGSIAGIIGAGEGGTVIQSSFWDQDTTGALGSDGTPKTTSEMKDIATYTDLNTAGLTAPWDFEGTVNDDEGTDEIWFIASDANNGYPCLTWVSNDCDFSLPTPADQDLNGDNIPDSEQPNVGGYVSSTTNKTVAIDVGEGCELTTDDMTTESQLDVQDPAYSYENGLWDFEADCGAPGHTTTVKLYYYDVSSDKLVLRKYNPISRGYATINDAAISETFIDGHQVTVVSYQVTDGGERDTDGLTDGTIRDPAGLASLVVGAPNTGLGAQQRTIKQSFAIVQYVLYLVTLSSSLSLAALLFVRARKTTRIL